MNRKILLAVVAVLIVVACFLAYFLLIGRKAPSGPGGGTGVTPGLPPVSYPTTPVTIPSGDKITLQTASGMVEVNNFYKGATAVTNSAALVKNEPEYQLVYLKDDGLFLIPIQAYSMADALKFRADAETDFLNSLGISKADVCKLDVDVYVPQDYVMGGSFAGRSGIVHLGLSFCPGGVK